MDISKELKEALEEAKDIIENPDKYPEYDNREDLKKALLEDDEAEKKLDI